VWADVSRSFAENQELEGNVGYRESSLKTIFILRWDGSHSMIGEKDKTRDGEKRKRVFMKAKLLRRKEKLVFDRRKYKMYLNCFG
jgi:hypothetical protein